MADIWCPLCGAPVEVDYLREVADMLNTTLTRLRKEYRRVGCAALDGLTEPTCARSGSDAK